MRRLQADYASIRAAFSGHPAVDVRPVGERLPPEVYEIRYEVPGISGVSGDEPEMAEAFLVELRLPRRYPAEPPYAVPRTPIFHPNVSEYYCIADDWRASTPIADVISRIGEMIQWREYNLASPLDEAAASWAAAQESAQRFPVGDVEMVVGEIEVGEATPHGGRGSQGRDRVHIDLDKESADPKPLVTLRKDPDG